MTAPTNPVAHYPYQNPHASSRLRLTLVGIPNTSPEQVVENCIANTARDELIWLNAQPLDERPAIVVGGGPSAADHIELIRSKQQAGGVVFAMNGSSAWLQSHGIRPDWQVIGDAKEESVSLVDTNAKGHLFSSVVNPKTMMAVKAPIVWHSGISGIEQCFPEHRKQALYTLHGGTTAGTYTLCLAHTLGHREMHLFGFDSSHRGKEGHSYSQPLNADMPLFPVTWAGKEYLASIDMKGQAERFPEMARLLKEAGCTIELYGDGLLQAMMTTPLSTLNERDKYRYIWTMPLYRERSFGEELVNKFLLVAKPKRTDLIIDYGCGTGRAGVLLDKLGYSVLLMDFADNCRDQEAVFIQFMEHDITQPIPIKSEFGFCTDVMEHIPTEDVSTVLRNIMAASETVFFQIALTEGKIGSMISATLHNTVKPVDWWAEQLGQFANVERLGDSETHCQFLAKKKDNT